MTIGIGCSSLIPGATIQQLLEAADRELYANKWLKKHPPATPPEIYKYAEDVAMDHLPVAEIRPVRRKSRTQPVTLSSRRNESTRR